MIMYTYMTHMTYDLILHASIILVLWWFEPVPIHWGQMLGKRHPRRQMLRDDLIDFVKLAPSTPPFHQK